MDWLIALGLLLVILATAPLWPALLRSGKRHRGGGAGPALSALNALFDPSQRHVAQVREQPAAERTDDEPKDP